MRISPDPSAFMIASNPRLGPNFRVSLAPSRNFQNAGIKGGEESTLNPKGLGAVYDPARGAFFPGERACLFAAPAESVGGEVELAAGCTESAPPSWYGCRGFHWTTGFKLTVDGHAPGFESWLVQHVRYREKYKFCGTREWQGTPEDYWEAWKIDAAGKPLQDREYTHDFGPPAGVKTVVQQGVDTYNVADIENTCGMWEKAGEFYWLSYLPAGFIPKNRDPRIHAGSIPSSRRRPPGLFRFTMGNTPILEKFAACSWSCCPNYKVGLAYCRSPKDFAGYRWRLLDGKPLPKMAERESAFH